MTEYTLTRLAKYLNDLPAAPVSDPTCVQCEPTSPIHRRVCGYHFAKAVMATVPLPEVTLWTLPLWEPSSTYVGEGQSVPCLTEDPDGEWVHLDDVRRIVQERDVQIAALRAERKDDDRRFAWLAWDETRPRSHDEMTALRALIDVDMLRALNMLRAITDADDVQTA
jgi:hypothetical protein